MHAWLPPSSSIIQAASAIWMFSVLLGPGGIVRHFRMRKHVTAHNDCAPIRPKRSSRTPPIDRSQELKHLIVML